MTGAPTIVQMLLSHWVWETSCFSGFFLILKELYPWHLVRSKQETKCISQQQSCAQSSTSQSHPQRRLFFCSAHRTWTLARSKAGSCKSRTSSPLSQTQNLETAVVVNGYKKWTFTAIAHKLTLASLYSWCWPKEKPTLRRLSESMLGTQVKEAKSKFLMSWKILKEASSYNPASTRCNNYWCQGEIFYYL